MKSLTEFDRNFKWDVENIQQKEKQVSTSGKDFKDS